MKTTIKQIIAIASTIVFVVLAVSSTSTPPEKCDCSNALDAALSAVAMSGASNYEDLVYHNKKTAKLLRDCDSHYDAREYMSLDCPEDPTITSYSFD